MSVLSYNEILPKKVIVFNDEPYIVVSSHVFRKQQRKPVNNTKLKNLKNGKLIENTFHVNETAEEADMEKRQITFIYEAKGEYWFHEAGNKSQRFSLSGASNNQSGAPKLPDYPEEEINPEDIPF